MMLFAFSNRFSVSVWTGKGDLKTLRVGAILFWKTEKINRLLTFKDGYMWMGLTVAVT